jgi:hypothetical protein
MTFTDRCIGKFGVLQWVRDAKVKGRTSIGRRKALDDQVTRLDVRTGDQMTGFFCHRETRLLAHEEEEVTDPVVTPSGGGSSTTNYRVIPKEIHGHPAHRAGHWRVQKRKAQNPTKGHTKRHRRGRLQLEPWARRLTKERNRMRHRERGQPG